MAYVEVDIDLRDLVRELYSSELDELRRRIQDKEYELAEMIYSYLDHLAFILRMDKKDDSLVLEIMQTIKRMEIQLET